MIFSRSYVQRAIISVLFLKPQFLCHFSTLIDNVVHRTQFCPFFAGMTNAEVLHQVEHGYRMQSPPNCPRALYDIMLECWHKDALKRPTFETLQWKLEDFFTMSDSEYRDATAY